MDSMKQTQLQILKQFVYETTVDERNEYLAWSYPGTTTLIEDLYALYGKPNSTSEWDDWYARSVIHIESGRVV